MRDLCVSLCSLNSLNHKTFTELGHLNLLCVFYQNSNTGSNLSISCNPVFSAFVELNCKAFIEQGDTEIRLSFTGV